jgi:hypothetical protein
MKELAAQVAAASATELNRVLTELEPLPVPALTLTWRGRASGKVLDGRIEAELALVAGGETAVTLFRHHSTRSSAGSGGWPRYSTHAVLAHG